MLARRLTAVTYRDTWTREGPAQHMLKLRASIMSLCYARDRPPRPEPAKCWRLHDYATEGHRTPAKHPMQHIE